jgi:hypothetical protein
MKILNTVIFAFTLGFTISFGAIADSGCSNCCAKMDGIRYCDSSAGRYVCNNGEYSSCYCTIHAVMDLQKIEGCCLWQGGVLKRDEKGIILCRDGTSSEICSINYMKDY